MLIINLLDPVLTGNLKETMSDHEVIELYLNTQNGSYFSVIYERYSKKVYGKCLSMLKSQPAAEDAVQEIFLKVMLNLSKFSGKSKFSTWLYSITYNFCIDKIRKQKRSVGVLVDDINEYGKEIVDDVDDSRILELNITRLKNILDLIPEGDKAILLMKYLEEFSIKEICDIVDKSESAVKMQIKRAKEKFVRQYDEVYQD